MSFYFSDYLRFRCWVYRFYLYREDRLFFRFHLLSHSSYNYCRKGSRSYLSRGFFYRSSGLGRGRRSWHSYFLDVQPRLETLLGDEAHKESQHTLSNETRSAACNRDNPAISSTILFNFGSVFPLVTGGGGAFLGGGVGCEGEASDENLATARKAYRCRREGVPRTIEDAREILDAGIDHPYIHISHERNNKERERVFTFISSNTQVFAKTFRLGLCTQKTPPDSSASHANRTSNPPPSHI